ncbi:MAG: DUF2752 domain-containing protein [Muribaculaceae bacterium]|nr:DUF2752 domain-containing protein [Muribaculaceae bacterium]
MPRCVFKAITGYDCPGCGSQRAFHALLHGNVYEAFVLNPAVFALVPLAVLYALAEWCGCSRLRGWLVNRYALCLLVAAIVLWTVARNVYIC